MEKNILITGLPHSGKSTSLHNLVSGIKNKNGFLTKEITADGSRVGFEIELSNGQRIAFAHVAYDESVRVSRYGVKVKNLELALQEIPKPTSETLLYLDEVGQMQLFSGKFKEKVLDYLELPNTFVATVSAVFKSDFIDSLKKRSDVIWVSVTPENRQDISLFLNDIVRKIETAKTYLREPLRFTRENESIITMTSKHGARTLSKLDNNWRCTCDFCAKWAICSHLIAAKELFNLS